jgi:hypothetical protein
MENIISEMKLLLLTVFQNHFQINITILLLSLPIQ